MFALPRRILLLLGLGLLLVIGVGSSLTRVGRADVGKWDPAAATHNAGDRVLSLGRHASDVRRGDARPSRRSASDGGQSGGVLPATTRPPAPVPLTQGWRSVPDPHNLGIAEDWGQGGGNHLPWYPVSVPNDFNSAVSDTSNGGAVAWYETEFTGPPVTAGRSWRVAFESVRRNAQVWLNGYKIGSSYDPYAPFRLPATTLMPGQKNLLIVRVDNVKGAGTLPEDWWNWGGIMGPVTLQPVGRLELQDLGVSSVLGCRFRCGDFVVQGGVVNRSVAALSPDIVVRVTSPSGDTVTVRHHANRLASGARASVSFRVAVRRPAALWSPRNPALYHVRVDVLAGGRTEQTETLSSGLRSVQVKGGLLYLNGRRLWLHGAAIHEDMPGRGAALTDGDIATIVSELRTLGANITRAHYLLSPRLLDALDQAGIMVWAQAPVDHADATLATARGRSHALSALNSTLLGDRSHPSVVIDSIGNELSPNPDAAPGTSTYLGQAAATARKLSPGVPVALDTYCYPGYSAQRIYSKLDVLGISHYFGWYSGQPGHSITDFNGLRPFLVQSHRRYPKLALAVSEFGAESLFHGPATTKGTYEFQSDYVTRTFDVLDRLPFMSGAIYWTLREFAVAPGWTGGVTLPPGAVADGIHHKGLIAYDGTLKPAFPVMQQLFATQPPFVR